MANETTADINLIRGYIKKYDKTIIKETLNGLDVFKDLKKGVMRNLLAEVALPKMTIDKGVRPLDTGIGGAKGKRTFTERTISPRFGMKIFSVIPEDYRETYMSEMLEPGAKREPFEKWMWAREFEKVGEEINDNFYNQEYKADSIAWAAATAYSTGDVRKFSDDIFYKANQAVGVDESPTTDPAKWDDVDNQVMYDGPGTIIATEITGANITPVVGAAITAANAYDQFKLVWDSIAEKDKNRKLVAYCSYDVYEDLIEHYNTKFGTGQGIGNSDLDSNKPFVLKGTAGRLTVRPASWMAGSQRLIFTVEGNIKVGTNQERQFNNVSKVIETLHGYDSVLKFALSCQIADLAALWVNDQV